MKTQAKRPASAPPPRRRRRIVPLLHKSVRSVGLVLLVAVIYAAYVLSQIPAGQRLAGDIGDRALAASGALGLVVSNIEVEGRETTDAATILAALAAERGTPILAVRPSKAREQLERLPWVRSAAIERRLPGTLYVRLVERKPLAVWQHDGKQELIDRQGEVIPNADLGRFSRLPSVVGDKAAAHAAGLIDMLAREPDLASRVTAAIRVDDRRWNLRVDQMIEVMLPEENAGAAWAQLAAMERQSSVLKRDVQRIDMRLPDRLVLRVNSPPASKEAAPAKPRPGGKQT